MTMPNGPELSEKNFISEEGYNKNPFPLWLWLFLITTIVALLWGVSNWYTDKINILFGQSPFLQVTNRDISLFLWQNPEYMRINAKEKGNYLPAFKYLDKVTIDLAYADQYAVAPPELLFRYHTWNRLISKEFTERPIPVKDFRNFLSYAEEWQPAYWPGATKEYISLVDSLPTTQVKDLATLSYDEMPLAVRMAFQGWENYFIDGEAINQVEISQKQLQEFLTTHPHYARNYWVNIVQDSVPNYLKSISSETQASDAIVPSKELSSFLKVAVYNYLKSLKASPPPKESTPSSAIPQKLPPKAADKSSLSLNE